LVVYLLGKRSKEALKSHAFSQKLKIGLAVVGEKRDKDEQSQPDQKESQYLFFSLIGYEAQHLHAYFSLNTKIPLAYFIFHS